MTIGRPIATSEPNVISRTTIAASSPMAVAVPIEGFCACSIAWPPSCDVELRGCERAFGDRDHAFDRRRRQHVRALVEVDGRERDLSRRARSRARPLAEYGLTTPLTCGSRATCASIGATRRAHRRRR